MKNLLLSLILLPGFVFAEVSAGAEINLNVSIEPIKIKITQVDDCTLSWIAPTEREDGTALEPSEIKSATIYAGVEPGVYTRSVEVVGATEVPCSVFEITDFVDHYFAGVIDDTGGLRSQLSNEVIKTSEELTPQLSPPKTLFFSGTITGTIAEPNL